VPSASVSVLVTVRSLTGPAQKRKAKLEEELDKFKREKNGAKLFSKPLKSR
jgi:hypothetical protein